MDRPFNLGVNEYSEVSNRNALYTRPSTLKAGESDSVAYSVYEIHSYDSATGTYTVKRPTSDSIANASLLFGEGHPISASDGVFKTGLCDGNVFWVAFDNTNGTPSAGDDVGTQSGSYQMLKGNTGYKCVAYDATGGLCLVRPFASRATGKQYIWEVGSYDSGVLAPTSSHTFNWQNLPSEVTIANGAYYQLGVVGKPLNTGTGARQNIYVNFDATLGRSTFYTEVYAELGDSSNNVLSRAYVCSVAGQFASPASSITSRRFYLIPNFIISSQITDNFGPAYIAPIAKTRFVVNVYTRQDRTNPIAAIIQAGIADGLIMRIYEYPMDLEIINL